MSSANNAQKFKTSHCWHLIGAWLLGNGTSVDFFLLFAEVVVERKLAAAQALEGGGEAAVAERGQREQGACALLVRQVDLISAHIERKKKCYEPYTSRTSTSSKTQQ
jgi:hypothetical protein